MLVFCSGTYGETHVDFACILLFMGLKELILLLLLYMESGKAQLVESGTKKPGIVLTWV